MVLALLLSLPTAWLAFTVSETALFAPFRGWAGHRSPWLGKLVGCGYCLSLWIAVALVALYQPRLFASGWPIDHLLTACLVAWLASFQEVALSWLMERAGK